MLRCLVCLSKRSSIIKVHNVTIPPNSRANALSRPLKMTTQLLEKDSRIKCSHVLHSDEFIS